MNRVRINEKEVDESSFTFKQARKRALASFVEMSEPFAVETLEGTMTGKAGDYLMRGVKGELYPCDREIFVQSYEVVE